MGRTNILPVFILAIFITAGAANTCWSQEEEGTVPVSVIASVEAKHGKEVPVIHREDVRVMHNQNRLRVTEWTPCQSKDAGIELFLLVDDSASTDIGVQIGDIKKFIQSQPQGTLIGVAYARNGIAQVLQNPSSDHAQAAKALRLPMGFGATTSPYLSVTDLVKKWPTSAACREVLMISSGIDFLQGGPDDSYLAEAIDAAQRAAVQVYGLYANAPGHFGHSFFRINWGQFNLSRLTEETGGEFYIQGITMPISYGPYLEQYASRLAEQFKLTFLAKPGEKSGFQSIRLETEVTNAELVGPSNVYVPSGK